MYKITDETPIAMLTVGQLREILSGNMANAQPAIERKPHPDKREVYGIPGLAGLFGCSKTTATRIKKSGRIDAAISQVGRTITIDADLALELAKEHSINPFGK